MSTCIEYIGQTTILTGVTEQKPSSVKQVLALTLPKERVSAGAAGAHVV